MIRVILLALIFGGVFYLASLFYPKLEGLFRKWQAKRMAKITPKINEMFLEVPLKKLMLLDVAIPAVCGIAGLLVFKNWAIAAGSAAFGLLIPLFIVKNMEKARRNKFISQLIDGLMILSSSLKAGLSLTQALEALAEEMPAPLSQEIGLVVRQVQMGVSLDEALLSLKKRMRVDELDMVVSAIMVARETGGNLTEIFSQLASAMQERNKIISKVNALCIQGKLQGAIMSILPIMFGLFVYKIDPHFFDIFMTDGLGKMLLGYAVVSEVIGVILIRKFSIIDI